MNDTTITRVRVELDRSKVFQPNGPSIHLYETWSDEYGRRGNVLIKPWTDESGRSGTVVLDINTDPVHYAYRCYGFADMASFNAYRREVEYVDREHRFPGVNPHRQPWII